MADAPPSTEAVEWADAWSCSWQGATEGMSLAQLLDAFAKHRLRTLAASKEADLLVKNIRTLANITTIPGGKTEQHYLYSDAICTAEIEAFAARRVAQAQSVNDAMRRFWMRDKEISVERARAEERERCAKIAENAYLQSPDQIATAIRALPAPTPVARG